MKKKKLSQLSFNKMTISRASGDLTGGRVTFNCRTLRVCTFDPRCETLDCPDTADPGCVFTKTC